VQFSKIIRGLARLTHFKEVLIPSERLKKKKNGRWCMVVSVLCNGEHSCNMIAFIGSAIVKLVDACFLTRIDVHFAAHGNLAIVSMPIITVQSHVIIIR
jgi:hypothetical protein